LLCVCFYELIATRIWKRVNEKSDIIFLFWPSSIKEYFTYFSRAYVLQDVTFLLAILNVHKTVRIIKPNNLKNLNSKQIVFHSLNPFQKKKTDYFKSQGELLFKYLNRFDLEFRPSANECRLWENKLFMHDEFLRLKIESPLSHTIKSVNDLINYNLDFPILCKVPNANHSRGIDWHGNLGSLKLDIIEKLKTNEGLIIQEVIPSMFDIRVVTVGSKVEYFYWRFKESSEKFTTTSTSNGSVLSQDPLPIELKNVCINTSKKLKLNLAAYDVTFIKLEGQIKPIIYEVSSSFLLNPLPGIKYRDKPYLNYKAKVWKFTYERLKQFTELKTKQVQSYE